MTFLQKGKRGGRADPSVRTEGKSNVGRRTWRSVEGERKEHSVSWVKGGVKMNLGGAPEMGAAVDLLE